MNTVLFLCGVLAVAFGERININSDVDNKLKLANEAILKSGKVSFKNPPAEWEGGSHTGGETWAIDSMQRTADCWVNKDPGTETYEQHIGLRVLTTIIPHLTLNGVTMTGLQRVGVNSAKSVTKVTKSPCSVDVQELKIESLDKVMFYSSLKAYGEKDISAVVREKVLPVINKRLDDLRPKVSKIYTERVCKHQQPLEHEDILLQVFNIM